MSSTGNVGTGAIREEISDILRNNIINLINGKLHECSDLPPMDNNGLSIVASEISYTDPNTGKATVIWTGDHTTDQDFYALPNSYYELCLSLEKLCLDNSLDECKEAVENSSYYARNIVEFCQSNLLVPISPSDMVVFSYDDLKELALNHKIDELINEGNQPSAENSSDKILARARNNYNQVTEAAKKHAGLLADKHSGRLGPNRE